LQIGDPVENIFRDVNERLVSHRLVWESALHHDDSEVVRKVIPNVLSHLSDVSRHDKELLLSLMVVSRRRNEFHLFGGRVVHRRFLELTDHHSNLVGGNLLGLSEIVRGVVANCDMLIKVSAHVDRHRGLNGDDGVVGELHFLGVHHGS
jgi:hypothetical protein